MSDFNRPDEGDEKGRSRLFAKVALFAAITLGGTAALSLPAPYLIEAPGPAFNLLGTNDGKPAIEVEGLATYPTAGSLNLMTVNVIGSRRQTPSWVQLASAWLDPAQSIVSIDLIYPPDEDPDLIDKQNAEAFNDSMAVAKSVVYRELAIAEDAAQPVEVLFHLDSVGGPSGGMMFALALYDLLTPNPLTGGFLISGTGTIDANGNIGPIGGIQQKMYAALRADSKFFLAPAENCAEVRVAAPKGLQVVAVETFDDAVNAARTIANQGSAASLKTCN